MITENNLHVTLDFLTAQQFPSQPADYWESMARCKLNVQPIS